VPQVFTTTRLLRAACGLVLASLCASPARADTPPSDLGVVVRAYNQYGVTRGELDLAEATLRAIFTQAGVRVIWLDCTSTSDARAERCDRPRTPNELILRIIARPKRSSDVLGESLVTPLDGGGSLATVFADSVRAFAGPIRALRGAVLGRVVAHEIGHLLMNSVDHSVSGLMRRWWAPNERAVDDWLFTPRQAAAIRESLEARYQTRTRLP
jgi:hypothetical protein